MSGIPAATIGHTVVGTCYAHKSPKSTTGIIIQGAATVTAEGAPASRLTDTVVLACGHSAIIASGSPTVISEGLQAARITDAVSGVFIGIIASGCATVYSA